MSISWQKAQELVVSRVQPRGFERLPLNAAAGRCLAEDVLADRDFPPTDRSAMDGFALRSVDFTAAAAAGIRIAGESAAGHPYPHPVAPGACIRIMTGAVVPPDTDTVIRQEDCTENNGILRISAVPEIGANIRRRGEEAAAGTLLLPAGIRLHPAAVALAAAAGRETVNVCRLPKVAIVCTGSELEKTGIVRPEQLRDANGPALAAALKAAFGLEIQPVLAADEAAGLHELLRRTLDVNDAVILTGGVSVGKYDLVPETLRQLGAETVFHGVAVKPGKPQLYAVLGEKQIFALSGNPLGVQVGLYLFVLPALKLMSGSTPKACRGLGRLPLAQPAKGRRDRTELHLGQRIATAAGQALKLLPCRGSADLVTAARADCFVIIEPNRQYATGEIVEFIPWLE